MAIAEGLRDRDRVRHRRAGRGSTRSASSLLINAYVARHDAAQRPLGLRGRAARPTTPGASASTTRSARGRDHARQRRADQRRPLLRRPRPSGDLHPGGRHGARGRALRPGGRGDHPPHDGPRRAKRPRPSGAEVIVHKNNSDGKGNSYGCHENYLLARETPFGRIVAQVTPHFVTRQVFTRRRQGRLRAARRAADRCRTSSASGPTSSRRRSGWRRR